jgi:pteridine reductase
MSVIDRPIAGSRPVALVTGGAKRVGRAICLELARRGCDIVLTRNTSAVEADETARDIESLGVAAAVGELDLSDVAGAKTWAEALAGELPRLDVLVHSASTYEPSPLDGFDVVKAEAQLRVNALAPLALSAALAPVLSRSTLPGGGAIVAMLDIHAAGVPRREHAAYAMSKAALGAMVRSLALDLAPGVRVNGVAPGVVAWPDRGRDADPAVQEQYLARVPLGRSGTPEEAAGAVAFLALNATYTTGTVLDVDGGRSLR